MSFFKNYIEYLKDNPEGYWFKRKLYGWGWTPARPQGFAVVFGYLVILIALLLTLDPDSSGSEVVFMFFLPFAILTNCLLVISYKRGEPPRWQWGLKDQEIKKIDSEV